MPLPLKICAERTTQEDTKHLEHLKKISKSKQHYDKLRAAFLTAKLWPNNSTVTVAFLGKPDNVHRTSIEELEATRDSSGNSLKIDPLQYKIDKIDIIPAVKKIVKERIEPIINLKFKFVDNPSKAKIRISFEPDQGAWSLVGNDCLTKKDPKEATMNLGWFDVPTTIHEFFHACALIHEHQNPKGNVIHWDEEAVYSWAEQSQGWDHDTTYRNIIEKYASNQINGSEYDPKSIMLYFFPASLTTDKKGTHQNLMLSPYDVLYVNSVYPNSPKTPQEFYKEVYGEEIGSIAAFDRNENKFKGGNKGSSNNPSNNPISSYGVITWIGIIVGVSVLLYIFIHLFLIKNKKNNYDGSYIKKNNYTSLFK